MTDVIQLPGAERVEPELLDWAVKTLRPYLPAGLDPLEENDSAVRSKRRGGPFGCADQ